MRLRQPWLPGGVLRRRRPLARDAEEAAREGRSPELARLLAEKGRLDASDVAIAASAGDGTSLDLIRDGGARVGQVIASLVSFFNPGLVVIGGGVTGLGHTLLASIRTQVYRQSLPLATGNLPIVLGELGQVAGASPAPPGSPATTCSRPRNPWSRPPRHRTHRLPAPAAKSPGPYDAQRSAPHRTATDRRHRSCTANSRTTPWDGGPACPC